MTTSGRRTLHQIVERYVMNLLYVNKGKKQTEKHGDGRGALFPAATAESFPAP